MYGHLAHLMALRASRRPILRCRRPAIVFPNSQGQYSDDRGDVVLGTHFCAQNRRSTSLYQADVPLQVNEHIRLARTVRECVRVRKAGEHAN